MPLHEKGTIIYDDGGKPFAVLTRDVEIGDPVFKDHFYFIHGEPEGDIMPTPIARFVKCDTTLLTETPSQN